MEDIRIDLAAKHAETMLAAHALLDNECSWWTLHCTAVTAFGDWATRDENQLTVQMAFFLGGFGTLYLCMVYCQVCVFGVLAFAAITCLQYRLMNLLMWAAILALWFNGWAFSHGKLAVSWG